jgi:hypothetical protein
LGSPDAAEIRLGYSPVAKRNGIKLFSLIPKGIQQQAVGATTRVKLLAPKFLDFKFILSVCSGCKGRDQHRERIGVAYLPSN